MAVSGLPTTSVSHARNIASLALDIVDAIQEMNVDGTMIQVPSKLVRHQTSRLFNPFTPKSYQFHISPAASQEIQHHSMENFSQLTEMKDDYTAILATSLIHLSLKGWNVF